MSNTPDDIEQKVNHLFRHEYGKIVSVLTKRFGASRMELAEDVVQDAMLEALQQWSYKGVPDNPVGWIYQVARYKAISVLEREQYKRKYEKEARALAEDSTSELIFSDKEIADDQLRMMFTCFHPSISTDSQIALTLKTLCGFSIPEIARAFFTSEENINKRLVRARKSIREENLTFEVPTGTELEPRLKGVLEAIYLLFNEGYNASSGNLIIRYELCEEAIRLTEIIASNDSISRKSTVYALLALMSLNASRFNSRTNEFNELVDLEHQDRDQWDQELIKKGLYYLEFAAEQNEVSLYHILATISAHYSTAKTFDAIDWNGILSLYDLLTQIHPSPITKFNRAIIISKVEGPKEAIREINSIKEQSVLESYPPYFISKSELLCRQGDINAAIELLESAKKVSKNDSINSFIISKIKEYEKES